MEVCRGWLMIQVKRMWLGLPGRDTVQFQALAVENLVLVVAVSDLIVLRLMLWQ